MMKKLYPLFFVIAVPLILILMSNSTGSIGGKTGSIGDSGTTCTECHGGSAEPMTGWITTNVPTVGYTPGETYLITATGTHSGVVKFGFELTVENSSGDKVGTLQLIEPSRTRFTNSDQAVTHTADGNIPSGNTNSWTMNWVAPSDVEGDVGIYAAFNAANGNGGTSGDVIYKSEIFIMEAAPAPLLSGIVPDNAYQGDMVNTTISGENTEFSGTPDVYLTFSGNGLEVINATNVVVESEVLLQADFDIPATASVGLWDLHVNSLLLEDAFTVNLITGIADNANDITRIYPNPANDHFFVEDAVDALLSVYNVKGELVTNLRVTNNKQLVNINDLANGLYIIMIEKNGNKSIDKILVN